MDGLDDGDDEDGASFNVSLGIALASAASWPYSLPSNVSRDGSPRAIDSV